MEPSQNSSSSASVPPPSTELDPRIHFDKTTSKWLFEADDGNEYEWIESSQSWEPHIIDQPLYPPYPSDDLDNDNGSLQMNKKEQIKAQRKLQREQHKKRSHPDNAPPIRRNTAIYLTHLPHDVTVPELSEKFSRAGLILIDEDNHPKIKLYNDPETKQFNGNALIVYLKEDSVELAIKLFDESNLRDGDRDQLIRVSRADFTHKASNQDQTDQTKKQKRAKKVEKLKTKLEEWDSDEEKDVKEIRTVVLWYMFTIDELSKDPCLLLDLKEDVRDECELLGNVTNVTLYDLEEDGIMTVKFKEPIAAQACILKMNNRFFAGRQVKATLDDGKRRFHKSSGKSSHADHNKEVDEQEKKRLDDFARFLEVDEQEEKGEK